MTTTREYFRFKWSHEHVIHRFAVRVFNTAMRLIPLPVKYWVGKRLRLDSYPYKLIHEGSVVVQVGAPEDTLHSGRSRGMYFSLFAGNTGKVILIEPDVESLKEYEIAAEKLGRCNILSCPVALWSEKRKIIVYINKSHPASSFSEGTKNYDSRLMKSYQTVELDADTLDNVLAERGIEGVHLVSITTNGAEKEILAGMKRTIAQGLPFICLAKTGENYVELMESLGYKLIAYDDRGYTFQQVEKEKLVETE